MNEKVSSHEAAHSESDDGLWVLHLFCHLDSRFRYEFSFQQKDAQKKEILKIIERFKSLPARAKEGYPAHKSRFENQLLTIAVLGHKADIALMALSRNGWHLRKLQTEISQTNLTISDSYLSLTEISEYAKGLPDEMKMDRLYPKLPPKGKPIWGFYPMSKSRGEVNNWYTLPYEKRKELMYEHGASGRKFSGRVLQVITGSTGIDDFEWGVTLFCQTPDDLKEVVYTLRFDEASAKYGEFGTFYTGIVGSPDKVLDLIFPA